MAKIDKDPIILHIINYYVKFGYDDFILALGYKGAVIKNYFKKKKKLLPKVKCINTGNNTLTGSRLLKLKKYLSKLDIIFNQINQCEKNHQNIDYLIHNDISKLNMIKRMN